MVASIDDNEDSRDMSYVPGAMECTRDPFASIVSKYYARLVAHPLNYWEYVFLRLYFADKSSNSIDNVASKKYKITATAPHDYVVQMQRDLIALGYLPAKDEHRDGYFGPQTRRAVARFQRHARRPYRMPQPDATVGERFTGQETGECDHSTALELRKWLAKGHKVPVGRFPIVPVTGGALRQDAAAAWTAIIAAAEAQGATLAAPYGDTTRALRLNSKAGTSRYSFHYCGRAVDINQELGGGKHQRYFIVREPVGDRTYWRLYCTTTHTSGAHIKTLTKDQLKQYTLFNHKESSIPAGRYVDLTALIDSSGLFERIPAQPGWEHVYDKAEWWHFQYTFDRQATFQDEMELIGYTEAQLRAAGWSDDDMLDHKPG